MAAGNQSGKRFPQILVVAPFVQELRSHQDGAERVSQVVPENTGEHFVESDASLQFCRNRKTRQGGGDMARNRLGELNLLKRKDPGRIVVHHKFADDRVVGDQGDERQPANAFDVKQRQIWTHRRIILDVGHQHGLRGPRVA